jgi:hypothetical protein
VGTLSAELFLLLLLCEDTLALVGLIRVSLSSLNLCFDDRKVPGETLNSADTLLLKVPHVNARCFSFLACVSLESLVPPSRLSGSGVLQSRLFQCTLLVSPVSFFASRYSFLTVVDRRWR